MENIIFLQSAAAFDRYSEIAGIYYTSIPFAIEGMSGPLARILLKESSDVYDTTHSIAKEIEAIAFPVVS